jgi:excisionase family DNA binding protein
MSNIEDTTPRNRHERRALEAGHEPLAVPMTRVPTWLGISRSKAYEEIAAGRLQAVKCGTRTLVPYASGEAWLASLPAMNA